MLSNTMPRISIGLCVEDCYIPYILCVSLTTQKSYIRFYNTSLPSHIHHYPQGTVTTPGWSVGMQIHRAIRDSAPGNN